MNSYTLSLSSNDTNYIYHSSEIELDDHTNFNVDISALSEKVLPIFLKIDWGDGRSQTFNNDVFKTGRENINIFKYSPLLTQIYSNEYYPSETSLYKSLTAQFLVNYSNGEFSWFVIPISIRSYDYFESIYDLQLINTNILPDITNPKEHQFKTDAGSFIIDTMS
jgi:hypothetical protein